MPYDELSSDEDIARRLSEYVRDQTADLPLERRNMIALTIAVALAEGAAYDLAHVEPPETTASILLAAAQLDRHAERQMRRASVDLP